MVNEATQSSQVAMNIANGQTPPPSSVSPDDIIDVETNTSATHVAAEKPAVPPPASSDNNNAVNNSESKGSETSPSQPPSETGEVVMNGELRGFTDMFDLDQNQQTVPAQADKTIVEVGTDTTDPLAPQQEQKFFRANPGENGLRQDSRRFS